MSGISTSIEGAIEREVKRRILEIIAEEVTKASAEVTKRLASEADRMALSVLREYEMSSDVHHFVIKVKKP